VSARGRILRAGNCGASLVIDRGLRHS
jgi:hypothetical protein